MMRFHRPVRPLARLLTAALLLSLAACSGDSKREDLNVLIPRMFANLQGPSAVQAASEMFDATNPDARRIAIATISDKKWGHQPPYMRAYRTLANDPDPLVRGQAMRALGGSHQADVADVLIRGLGDRVAQVRVDASAAASDVTNPLLVPPLLEHLRNDTDTQVRINCAQALRPYTGRQDVLNGLIHALDDSDAAVVYWAHLRLQQMTGQQIPPDARTWLQWLEAHQPTSRQG